VKLRSLWRSLPAFFAVVIATRSDAQQCSGISADQSVAAIGAGWSVQPTPCMQDGSPPQIMPSAPTPLVVTEQKLRATGDAPGLRSARAGGDPVLGDGEFYEQRTDIELGGFGLRYAFVRTYRSRVSFLGGLGFAWDHNYDKRILGTLLAESVHPYGDDGHFNTPNGGLDYQDGALNLIHFAFSYRDLKANILYYTPPAGVALSLEQHLSDHTFWIRDASGGMYQFDIRGQLVRIQDLVGNAMTFEWEMMAKDLAGLYSDKAYRGFPYRLKSVHDTADRDIRYVYDPSGYLQCVTTGADCSSGSLVSFKIDPGTHTLREVFHGTKRVERYAYDQVRQSDYPYAPTECIASGVIPALCDRFCNKTDRADWANTCLNLDLEWVVRSFCQQVDCQWHDGISPPQLQCKRASHATPDPLCMGYNNALPDCQTGCRQRWQCEATFPDSGSAARFSYYSFGVSDDLKYDLTDIYDENDQLVVHNTYGGNSADVSYDRVVSQQIGPSGGNPNVLTFEYHDFGVETGNSPVYIRPYTRRWPAPPSPPDPTYVQSLTGSSNLYEPVQACPWSCTTKDPNTGACLYRSYAPARKLSGLDVIPYLPKTAVVVRDMHGATRTLYYNSTFDILREVVAKNDTAQEDTYYDYERGFRSGTLEPSGVRNCIAPDDQGRPVQVTTLPAPGFPGDQTPHVAMMTYDGNGQLLRVAEDAAGSPSEIRYHRDAKNRVDWMDRDVRLGYAAQRTTFTYDDDPAPVGIREIPATVTMPDGTKTRYMSLDPSGGGPRDTYLDAGSPTPEHHRAEYDSYGRMRLSEEVGRYGRAWDYDDANRISAVSWRSDPASSWVRQETTYHESAGPKLDVVKDAKRSTSYKFHGSYPYLVTKTPLTTDAGEKVQQTCLDYTADGWLQTVVLPEGNELHYSRDSLGRVRTVMKGYPQQPPPPQWWRAECDGNTRPASDPGYVLLRSYEYLPGGFLTRISEDNVVRVVTTDGFGRTIQLATPNKDIQTDNAAPVQTGYDTRGRVIWRAEFWNNPTAYPRVAYAKPTMAREGLLSMVEYEYDFRDRVVSQSRWSIETNGVLTTTTTYDDVNRIVTTTDRGLSTVTTFDRRGRLISRVAPDQSTQQVNHYVGYDVVTQQTNQSAPLVRTLQFDTRNNLTGMLDENGQPIYAAGYDADGHQWFEQQAGAGAQTRYFDAFGRPSRATVDLANGQTIDQRFGWDRNDRQTSFVDGLKRGWRVSYSGFDQPLQIVDPSGRIDQFVYSGGFTQPAGRIDAVGRHHCFRYDDEMQLRYLYDADCPAGSDLRGPAPPLLERKVFTYGSRGELMTAGTYSDAPHGVGQAVVRYAYDSLGRNTLNEVESIGSGAPSYTITHAYADQGRTVITQAQQLTVGDDGVCKPGWCPPPPVPAWTASFRQTYDGNGRLASTDFNGTRIATWSYGVGTGGPLSVTYGNGAVTSFTYDNRLRQRRVSVTAPPSGVAMARLPGTESARAPGIGTLRWSPPDECSGGVWCPPKNQPVVIATLEDAFGADSIPRMRQRTFGVAALTDVYQVDGGGRVTAESLQLQGVALPAGEVSEATVSSYVASGTDWRLYGVDANGDWRSVAAAARGGAAIEHQVDGLGRLTAIGGQAMNLDAHDNLLGLSGDPVSFSFDGATGLMLAARNGGVTHNYRYDAAERRALDLASDGTTTAYIWDGDKLIAHGDPNNLTIDVPGGDVDEHIVSVTNLGSGTRSYYHRASDYSVFAVTDGSGNLAEGYSYSAFGEPTIFSPGAARRANTTVGNPFLFQGHVYDSSTGTYYMRARQYAPRLGRFLSPDPLGAAPAPSRYSFTSSTPLSSRDPMGLWPTGFGLGGSTNPVTRAEEDRDPGALGDIVHDIESAVANAGTNLQIPPIPAGEGLDPAGSPIADNTVCGSGGCKTYESWVTGYSRNGLTPQYMDSLDVFRTPGERLDRSLTKIARRLGVNGAKLTTNGDYRDVLDQYGRKIVRAYTHRASAESDWLQPQELLLGPLLVVERPAAMAAEEASETAPKLLLPGLKISESQFGKKAAKHARDFGLEASSASDRQILRDKIESIVQVYEEVKQGAWRGGATNNLFFRSGADVVVTTANGDYVTILSGGASNGWFNGAGALLP
jgi:RHS repeat-associated protein